MSEPVASVVIGFKDWGLDRLERCIMSIHESFGDIRAEVVVSDYGSSDAGAVRATAESAGARYVRTETDGTWSRSRALNAGFAITAGDQIYATDADMIFTPGALQTVSRRLAAVPDEAVILQCRDLPPGAGTEPTGEVDWEYCSRVSTIRPRWGMGGLVGTHRSAMERLRGYDERMHTYGGEDIDYAKRLRRLGMPINWLDRPGVRMYHVWHPSSSLAASLDDAATAAIAHNRRIHTEDGTTARNRRFTECLNGLLPPLVSVVAVADAPADELAPELGNLLGQSLTDLEIVLVDAGHGHAVAQALGDVRVRVVEAPQGPWWRALAEARGTYLALHASGTWHAPNRFEQLLEHTGQRHVIPADTPVTVVRSDTGQLVPLPARPGMPQRRSWSSLLMPTDTTRTVLRTIDGQVEDPHDLVLALIRNGLEVQRTSGTRVDVLPQALAGELLIDQLDRDAVHLAWMLRVSRLDDSWLGEPVPSTSVDHAVAAAEHLMRDRVDLVVWSSEAALTDIVVHLLDDDTQLRQSWVADADGEPLFTIQQVAGLPGAAARRLRLRAHDSVAAGRTRIERLMDDGDMLDPGVLPAMVQELSHLYADDPDTAAWVVVRTADAADAATATQQLSRLAGVDMALHRILREPDTSPAHLAMGLTRTTTAGLEALLAAREASEDRSSVELWLGPGHRGMTFSDLLGVGQ